MTTLDWVSELPPFLERLVDGEFTCEDWARLNEFLSQGDQPRRYYHRYMKVHAALEWRNGGRNEAEAAKRWTPGVSCPTAVSVRLATIRRRFSGTPSYRFVRQRIPRCGRLLLLGLAGSVSRGNGDFWDRAADRLPHLRVPACTGCPTIRPSPLSSLPSPLNGRQGYGHGRLPVGRSGDGGFQRRQVPLGRKYALASGLMEITYDTGAKVILQGPATYEMEANGGYIVGWKTDGEVGEEE